MSDKAETAAIRLWRDRAHLREQERDEAQARARIAEEKVAILTAENDRLAEEVARLRALLNPDAARARAETEQQMADLRTALLALLDQSSGRGVMGRTPSTAQSASSAARYRASSMVTGQELFQMEISTKTSAIPGVFGS